MASELRASKPLGPVARRTRQSHPVHARHAAAIDTAAARHTWPSGHRNVASSGSISSRPQSREYLPPGRGL